MDSSTGGFRPTQAEHIRESALCGSCHQLYTTARGEGGKNSGYLPEQMPYLEWLHSDYPNKYSCQACHMPEVHEPVRISSALGVPRTGLHQHVFVGGNFLLQGMLNRYRDDLAVDAQPQELTSAAAGTLAFLQSQSARVTIRNLEVAAGNLRAEVFVQNLTGHKLPTAYPSRRAWIHFVVRDRHGNTIFESGALSADGSIKGNDNDADKERYEPHYAEITSDEQVEIYEAILKDTAGRVTTGLLAHVFVGGNFLLQGMLNRYRDDLAVDAQPQELTSAAAGTLAFLQSQSARVTIRNLEVAAGNLRAEVFVQNLTGHKLPTAYPSRRAWIHFVVRDRHGNTIFESGALSADGSIKGNDNDADKERYEPHYAEITSDEQVEIYEAILKDTAGRVTTGLLAAIGYLKDNRLLPTGFDKKTADKDIAVVGEAADEPNFTAGGDLVRYSISTGNAEGPFHVEAELWYQPIGFRWAHNLAPYNAAETQRFVHYYESMSSTTGTILARAEATH
ncbi:MAG: hypothetical protein DMG68_00925 [Acidobacteria bacterium]|nr:MAG: hypothetical protein DMG68_00925 [Acidobacteriota bacterium]